MKFDDVLFGSTPESWSTFSMMSLNKDKQGSGEHLHLVYHKIILNTRYKKQLTFNLMKESNGNKIQQQQREKGS